MDRDSFDRALLAAARRTPFRPFEVELASGTPLRILHPEALVFRGGVAFYMDPAGDWALIDHEGVSQITSRTDQAASA